MAQPSRSILQKRLEKVLIDPTHVRETGSELGRGAYAVVVELEAFGMRWAGKRLHDAFFNGGKADESNGKILSDFASEILQMRKLRHPNIVQFLGIVCSDSPVTLVMEYVPTTLGQCLEDEKYRDPNPGIPSFIKNSLLLDIALGLCYLHGQSPPVIHRDLSSNNVLITSTWQAKISDLGVAKALKSGSASAMLGELNPSIDSGDQQMHMSIVPGTDVFMSPECRKPSRYGKAVYGPKLDCFSFGNLIIMITLQTGWLESSLLSDVPDDAASKGQREVRRRSYYLSLMEDHPLQSVAVQCLLDDPSQRPSADDIVHSLKEVECNDPPPFANTLDLYNAFVRTKGEESEYQKKITLLDLQMKEWQGMIAELKQKHEEEIAELKREYEEKIAELTHQKHDRVSCSDAKTDHECELTTAQEMSHAETPRVGWTAPQDAHKFECDFRQPQITPRHRATSHPVPKPRIPRPLSSGVAPTGATVAPVADGAVSPTGGVRGAVAPAGIGAGDPGTPIPVPRARKKLSAALSVDSFMYIPQH